MQLSENQFKRQINYESSLSIAANLHELGLITEAEFSRIKARLINKFNPIIQH